MPNPIDGGADEIKVLYVYTCAECGHRGEMHLVGDGHDGEQAKCNVCDTAVTPEWDSGVVLERLPGSAH